MNEFLGLSNILTEVDAAVRAYTQNTYQALSGALMPTLQLVMTLYLVLFGIGHVTGRLQLDVWRIVKHLMVMVVIAALVSQWDFFALYLGNVFTDGPGQLMAIISGSANPNASLGAVMDKGILAANAINQNAGLSTLGFLIVGWSVFYMTLFMVGYALYLIVLSKIALGVLLGLAPLFFLFYFFDSTRSFVEHYIRQLFNFALIPVLTSAVLALMIQIPLQSLNQLQVVLASHSGHGGREVVVVILSFFILIGLLHQVTGLAAGLSGGGLHLHPGGFAAMTAAVALYATRQMATKTVSGVQSGYGYARRKWKDAQRGRKP